MHCNIVKLVLYLKTYLIRTELDLLWGGKPSGWEFHLVL